MSDAGQVLRTLLVDDHPLFRQGVRQVLTAGPDLDVVGEASDGATAMSLFNALGPGLVVLDINLPDASGLDLARMMLQQRPDVRVVILTMLRDEDILHAALGLGVLGYVLKECAADEIIDCIRAVAQGEPYVSAQLSSFLVRRMGAMEQGRSGDTELDRLTTAERRVLKLLAQTLTTKEIAHELRVSPRTIEAHRANIGGKLGLKGSHSLLRFAIANREALESL
jgi:two-component system, NarL family, response regulator DegU